MPAPVVAVVLKGWPRLSETFIAQELVALERRGLSLRVYSLRHPTDTKVHDFARRLAAPVVYLPEYLHREPLRVWSGWRGARYFLGYERAVAVWRADFARDRTRNRIRRFGQALVLAAELGDDVRHLYAHFLHTPASVARYAALLRCLPWSVSAHAKDIWTTPEWEKREKLADTSWAVTCTREAARHLAALGPGKVRYVPHGIDLARFPSLGETPSTRDGADPNQPVRILSVGRAVEKKGFDDLLEALARLPGDLHWRFVHVGGGPLRDALKAQAERLGLSGRIDWRGPATQDAVLAALRACDVFVLASRVAADGDRDGLPNVVLEAMSQHRAVLATSAAAIPEAITDGLSGALVPPGNFDQLARRLAALIAEPWARAQLGDAAAERVRRHFAFEHCIDGIAGAFDPSLFPQLEPSRAAE
ncbi:MAG: glycosyltransferase family 4 protein [Alphaproteobacteria bacterium]|nr:glycosyltransferase family 4 protein [Alphaproteobacteria bacterium]